MAAAYCAASPHAQEAQEAPAPQLELRGGDGGDPASQSADDDENQNEAPEKPKAKPVKKNFTKGGAPTLPALRAYPGAQRLGQRGGPQTPDQREDLPTNPPKPPMTPPPTIAALPPIPAKVRPRADQKPFEPVGVMLGDIKLLPSIEEDFGYSSNPAQLAGPMKGSAFETTQGSLDLKSDWARNELRGSLTGGYTDYFNAPKANAPNFNGVVDGRLDVSRDLALNSEGRFAVITQTPGYVSNSSNVVVAGNQRSIVETGGATIGAAQKFGDLTLSLHGSLDRTVYQDQTLSNGQVQNLAADNFDDWALRARASYAISPIIAPFVETVIDTRRYDSTIDTTGYARNSNGILGRGGVTLALSGQLTGEASLGYGVREYKDPRLPNVSAPLIDASLIWSATPLTTVTFKTATYLSDTTNVGNSGAITRSYTIDVSHALLRRLTLGATAGYATDVYVGVPLHDFTTSFGLRADYNISRDIVLRASAAHTQYISSAPNSNYIANVFMLGLRLQR